MRGAKPPPAARLVEERIAVGDANDAKLAAIAEYATQWPLFHPSIDAWRAALAEHAARMGETGATERRWRIV
jgi:hypothetical protein